MNLLILSASTGGGHNRASNALKDFILQKEPEATIEIIDAIETCSKLVNLTLTKGYEMIAKNIPSIYGAIYDNSDKDNALIEMLNSVTAQYAKKLLPTIEQMQPDVILATHPYCTEMMSTIKEKYGFNVPMISVVTDFMPHKAYVVDNIDAYITASADTSKVLSEKYGVSPSIIYDFGLPVFDRFYSVTDEQREKVFDELGFDREKKTILIMAGSFGVTDILKIYERIVDLPEDFQIIVITGRNKRLYTAFEKLLSDEEEFEAAEMPAFIRELSDDNPFKLLYDRRDQILENIKVTFHRSTKNKKPTKLFFFVDNVEDYMHISDLIITKPGGLTTAESIACALPMAIFKAIPGQETQNADFLVEKGIAVCLNNADDAQEKIHTLLSHPERLDQMRDACRRIERKNSCESLYRLIKAMIGEPVIEP